MSDEADSSVAGPVAAPATRGFALQALLAGVLGLGALMAVGIPAYVGSVTRGYMAGLSSAAAAPVGTRPLPSGVSVLAQDGGSGHRALQQTGLSMVCATVPSHLPACASGGTVRVRGVAEGDTLALSLVNLASDSVAFVDWNFGDGQYQSVQGAQGARVRHIFSPTAPKRDIHVAVVYGDGTLGLGAAHRTSEGVSGAGWAPGILPPAP